MEKPIIITLLLFLLAGCSQEKIVVEVEPDKYVKENSAVCLERLKNDEYIHACKDLESESREYINKVETEDLEVNLALFENIINDLTVISDVSKNSAIVKLAKDTKDSILNIIAPVSSDLNIDNYKEIEDEEEFKSLINGFENKTSLTYTYTDKYRISYDNKDIAYKTVFTDDNDILLTYYLNEKRDLEEIEISNNLADQVLYYNFVAQYTNYILIDQFDVPTRRANYDALLVEQILQFNSEGEFLSSVNIIVKDEKVIFKLN